MSNLQVFRMEAPLYRRVGAFLLDVLLVNILILSPLQAVLMGVLPQDYEAIQTLLEGSMGGTIVAMFFLMGLLLSAYFFLLEWQLGATVGKLLFGLRVESALGPITLWQGIVRSLFALPTFPFVLLWLFDPVMMVIHKEKQRLSEILSSTKTVYYVATRYHQ